MMTAREMYERAGWTIGFALILFIQNRTEYPGPALVLAAVITIIGLVMAGAGYGLGWLAGTGRQKVIAQVLDSLELQGSERILDIGSPGGALALAAARRLKSGKVVSLNDPKTNEAARELARNEGLGDRVRFEAPDWKKLSYPDANFDCVIGSEALGQLSAATQEQAIAEALRVLKPAGRLVVHENGLRPGFGLSSESSVPVGLPLGLGGRILTGRKA